MPTIEVTTPILSPELSSVSTLLDMCFEISDMPPAFGAHARTAGEAHAIKCLAHGACAVAVARGVDIGLGDGADVRPAAEETAEMSFLIAPCRDFDRAAKVGVGIDDAGGLQRIDDAKRPIEPARIILAFEMRAGQQLSVRISCLSRSHCRCHRLSRPARLGQALGKPLSERMCASEKVGL